MPVDLKIPIRCFLESQTPGEIFHVDFQEHEPPSFTFLDECGVVHWDLNIESFSTYQNVRGGTPYSTYVFHGDPQKVFIAEEFESPYLNSKPALIQPFNAAAKYVKTLTIVSGIDHTVDRVHLLMTETGMAICADFDVLFGVEPVKAEPKTSLDPPAREPIRTVGVSGARALDLLGISDPEFT